MDKFRVVCPNCANTMRRYLNPEIEVNKVRCRKCDGIIEVKFEKDEIQRWERLG